MSDDDSTLFLKGEETHLRNPEFVSMYVLALNN